MKQILSKPALLKKGLRLDETRSAVLFDPRGRNLPYLKRDCDFERRRI